MTLTPKEILDKIVGGAYLSVNDECTVLIIKSDAISAMRGYSDLQLKEEREMHEITKASLDFALTELDTERERAGKMREALENLMKGVAGLPPLTAIAGVLESQYKQAETALNNYK